MTIILGWQLGHIAKGDGIPGIAKLNANSVDTLWGGKLARPSTAQLPR